MNFRILGLPPASFSHLYGLDDASLREQGAARYIADRPVGFPDRIELRDAAPGEPVILVNYTHQPGDTPFRASHAIFVLEGAHQQFDRVDEVPEVMRCRTLSLRAFDAHHMMVDADLVEGREVESLIERLFAIPGVDYIQAHYARPGCYAARIERA